MVPSNSTTGAGVLLAFLKPGSTNDTTQENDKFALLHMEITANVLGIETATQYKAANAEYEKQHLVICETEGLARVNVKQMLKFLEGEDVAGEWDIRAFSEVEIFGQKKSREAAKAILVALVQPSSTGAEDLDAWYREEHNQQMSKQPGWLRTCRYSLLSRNSSLPEESGKSQELSFLAIHEFGQGEKLGDTVKALEPISEWTIKVMKDAVGIDAAIYRRI